MTNQQLEEKVMELSKRTIDMQLFINRIVKVVEMLTNNIDRLNQQKEMVDFKHSKIKIQ